MDISVIICTYNRAYNLKDCFDCLASQDISANVSWEVVLVDNNSTDNTKHCVEAYAATANFLLRYHFEPQQGLSHARNLGINSSVGDILVFTDDDVLPDSDWLTEIYNNMTAYNCDACGGAIAPKWETPPPSWLTEIFYGFLAIKQDNTDARQLSINDELPFGANMIFRHHLFDKYGLFDTQKGRKGNVLAGGEDIEMFERIIHNNGVVFYFPSIKVTHKVEAFRLKKNYFRRWRFQCSKNIAMTSSFAGTRTVFGIPFYLINQTIKAIITSIRYLITMPNDIAFRQEMIVWHFFGLIAGILHTK